MVCNQGVVGSNPIISTIQKTVMILKVTFTGNITGTFTYSTPAAPVDPKDLNKWLAGLLNVDQDNLSIIAEVASIEALRDVQIIAAEQVLDEHI